MLGTTASSPRCICMATPGSAYPIWLNMLSAPQHTSFDFWKSRRHRLGGAGRANSRGLQVEVQKRPAAKLGSILSPVGPGRAPMPVSCLLLCACSYWARRGGRVLEHGEDAGTHSRTQGARRHEGRPGSSQATRAGRQGRRSSGRTMRIKRKNWPKTAWVTGRG